MTDLPRHLAALESEAIHILRDGGAEARNPVLLFSGGKDSTVLAHLVTRAFYPARPPVPLLHIDSTWEFADVLAFRDAFAARHDFRLLVHANEQGGHGDEVVTTLSENGIGDAGEARRHRKPAPQGQWRSLTFYGALRGDGITAPCIFDSPIKGQRFRAYVEQQPCPALRPMLKAVSARL
jgi:hypothetical protein